MKSSGSDMFVTYGQEIFDGVVNALGRQFFTVHEHPVPLWGIKVQYYRYLWCKYLFDWETFFLEHHFCIFGTNLRPGPV